jgi:hypothetical protein
MAVQSGDAATKQSAVNIPVKPTIERETLSSSSVICVTSDSRMQSKGHRHNCRGSTIYRTDSMKFQPVAECPRGNVLADNCGKYILQE